MPVSRRILVVLLLFAFVSVGRGYARDWGAIPFPSLGEGVAVCEGAGNHHLCFGLRCASADRIPEWFTFQTGGDSATGDVKVSVVLDGSRHHNLPMSEKRRQELGEWEFAAQFEWARDSLFVDQLKAGSSIYVLIGNVSGGRLSLQGSTRAIDSILKQCRPVQKGTMPASPADDGQGLNASLLVNPEAESLALSRADMPAPLVAALNEIDAECGSERVDPDDSGFVAEDIDSDGIYDFLLDHQAFCPARRQMICGASHCPYTAVISAQGQWKRFDYILQGYRGFSSEGFLLRCPDGSNAGIWRQGDRLLRKFCDARPEVVATYSAAAPEQSGYPKNMATLMNGIREACAAGGSAVSFDGAISRFDFNGDGEDDYLLDTAQMQCREKMQYCAVNACQITLFVSHEGRHVEGGFLSAEPRIDGDRLMIPCPSSAGFSTVTFTEGRFEQTSCQ